MPNDYIALYRLNFPLKEPYRLSFCTIKNFATYYVVLAMEDGIGLGEITPLPGYNHETPESVEATISRIFSSVAAGNDVYSSTLRESQAWPFATSGVFCALETWKTGLDAAFSAPLATSIPLAAFCGGLSPQDSKKIAKSLVACGYSTLKMKVGANPTSVDIERVEQVCDVLPPGCVVRLDANQSYSMNQALDLCNGLEHLGKVVELLEQPFAPNAWEDHAQLITRTRLPIMLDESIYTLDDVRRAADCGAWAVKFKLCKHSGMEGSDNLIQHARELGLKIVYGNGVQSIVGNHLEAKIYARSKLKLAAELNGFLKPVDSYFKHDLCLREGRLYDGGVNTDLGRILSLPPIISAPIMMNAQ
jgi:o-succinylbenzoate synthase